MEVKQIEETYGKAPGHFPSSALYVHVRGVIHLVFVVSWLPNTSNVFGCRGRLIRHYCWGQARFCDVNPPYILRSHTFPRCWRLKSPPSPPPPLPNRYVRMKEKACTEAGIHSVGIAFEFKYWLLTKEHLRIVSNLVVFSYFFFILFHIVTFVLLVSYALQPSPTTTTTESH